MSTVMSELRQDHSNVREILGLLSRQLDAVSDASGGDFELMRDIKAFEAQVDPIFGPVVALEFDSLHDHIRNSAES